MIQEKMTVWRGNVNPFPIVDIILKPTLSLPILVEGDRSSSKVSKNHFGRISSHKRREIESEADDRSIVAIKSGMQLPILASRRLTSG
jgi:hypothetical protein